MEDQLSELTDLLSVVAHAQNRMHCRSALPRINYAHAVSYTHLDVYKRQAVHSFNTPAVQS